MALRKMLLVLLVPVIVEVVIACYECECRQQISVVYTNKSISVEHIDNSGEYPIEVHSGTVSSTAYGLIVTMYGRTVALNTNNSPSFFQFAYSCSCPDPYFYSALDSLVDFRIITLNDFDATHPASSDVSDYFRVHNYYGFETIDSYFNSWRSAGWYPSGGGDLAWPLILLLVTPPEQAGTYRFKVQLPLSDGRVLEQETTSIELTE